MYYALIAIVLMLASTTAVHMDLPAAVIKVVSKIANCHKCLTFWSTLCILLFTKCDIALALLLSLLGAYLSNWFALLLIKLAKLYTRLWYEVNRKR